MQLIKIMPVFSRPSLMLQCCVCLSSVRNILWLNGIVAKRCVLEQKLLLTAYRKSLLRNRLVPKNNLDLYLEVLSRSCQPLGDIRRWISRKSLEIEAWIQRTTNGKRHMGYQMVTWPMTSSDHESCFEAVRSAILATAWLLVIACPHSSVNA